MIALALALSIVTSAPDTCECPGLREATDLQLGMEMLARGYDRWGCWTEHAVNAEWTAPTEGSPVVWYVFEAEGVGALGEMTVMRRYVTGCEFITWWPGWVDSCRARVAGVDSLGRQGPWSEMSDWYIIEE